MLGLDPTARGLFTAERYRRSALLLKRAFDALNGCAGTAPAPEIAELFDRSAKALKSRVRPSDEADAMEENMESCARYMEGAWQDLRANHGAGTTAGAGAGGIEPLSQVLRMWNRRFRLASAVPACCR